MQHRFWDITEVLHWIVQHAVQVILIWTGVGWVSIIDLASAENTRGIVESWPESFIDMLSSINTKTID
jgi:hypothetical protein